MCLPACLVLTVLAIAPHGELDDRIRALDRLIARGPTAELHLRRGELHRLHKDPPRALADYARALELDPSLDAVHYARARLHFGLAQHARAEACVQARLKARPADGPTLALLAAIRSARGDHAGAERAWVRALPALDPLRPAHVLARVENLVRLGKTEAALRAVDDGLARLPRAASLELRGLALERELGRPEAAAHRLARLAAHAARPDRWLEQRARILTDAGLTLAARAAWQETLAALDALPPHRASAPETRGRRAAARRALSQLKETEDAR